MMKKLLFALVALVVMSLPAMAIQPPDGAKVPWGSNNTTYTAEEFNAVLEAYDLMLPADAVMGVPTPYAMASGDKVKFTKIAIAYSPADYDKILTAYGLVLKPENVTPKISQIGYASVKDNKVSFGKISTDYNKVEWIEILGGYSKVMAPAAVVLQAPTPKPGDSDGDGVADDKDACPGTPKGVKVDERGCWSYPATMLFDFDKAVIKAEYLSRLDEAKKVFDAYPSMTVMIVGYTCDMGSSEYNMGLSKRRAWSVRDYLVNQVGIDANRVKADGRGESNPAYPNDSDENRQKNRRVEFVPEM